MRALGGQGGRRGGRPLPASTGQVRGSGALLSRRALAGSPPLVEGLELLRHPPDAGLDLCARREWVGFTLDSGSAKHVMRIGGQGGAAAARAFERQFLAAPRQLQALERVDDVGGVRAVEQAQVLRVLSGVGEGCWGRRGGCGRVGRGNGTSERARRRRDRDASARSRGEGRAAPRLTWSFGKRLSGCCAAPRCAPALDACCRDGDGDGAACAHAAAAAPDVDNASINSSITHQ